MTALLLAAAFACGAALPAMAEQATPETAAQPDPTEWADEAQDVTEAEEAPVYQQADAQEVATGETAASLTVTAADCTAQFIDEAYRLFLPVNTDMAALTIETGAELAAADAEGLTMDGTTVSGDFTNIETLNLTFTDGKTARVELYKSQLPSVSFTLNGVTLDEIQAGSKDVKYKGNSVTISQAGGSDLTDTNVEFKGRGNTTWTLDKRPYQFKLSSKAKVLGMDKAKTWLLIANRQDTSMMRNKAVYDLANAMREWAPDGRWVDVWIDGSYQGCYLLCEKVQVGTNRVELEQEDGILAEADNIYYNGEEYWFTGNQSGTHFTLKDSAADDLDEQDSATLKAWSGFETALDEFEDVQYGFDPIMGTMLDCQWLHTEVGDYWYEGGIRQGTEGRGKEIYDLASDAWYWLDAVDNGKKAVSKDVYQESDGGKWVRYDADGHMIKGWDTQGVDRFYFDPITGAMAKGVVMIDGIRYWFDSRTGALIAPK